MRDIYVQFNNMSPIENVACEYVRIMIKRLSVCASSAYDRICFVSHTWHVIFSFFFQLPNVFYEEVGNIWLRYLDVRAEFYEQTKIVPRVVCCESVCVCLRVFVCAWVSMGRGSVIISPRTL